MLYPVQKRKTQGTVAAFETLECREMACYDLTSRIAPNLDRHLVFPLLEFLQERTIYDDNQILKGKIDLLRDTNMVDYAMDIHKSLYQTQDVPEGFQTYFLFFIHFVFFFRLSYL